MVGTGVVKVCGMNDDEGADAMKGVEGRDLVEAEDMVEDVEGVNGIANGRRFVWVD